MIESNRFLLPLGNGRLIQFLMNIIPFLGVAFMGWSVFALIYSFWLETLAESFFNAIKVAFAGKNHKGISTYIKAIRFFIGRVLILLFYLIFIIVFVGVMVSMNEEGARFAMYMLFLEPTFKITMLSFFILKAIEIGYHYFYLNERMDQEPETHAIIFDRRTTIIHIVIVVGVFAYEFFSKRIDSHTGVVAFAAVFVLVKILAEGFSNIISSNASKEKVEEDNF